LGGNDPNIAAMEDAAIMIERDRRAGNKDPKSTNNVFHMSVNPMSFMVQLYLKKKKNYINVINLNLYYVIYFL
jgi:hypothetical protein